VDAEGVQAASRRRPGGVQAASGQAEGSGTLAKVSKRPSTLQWVRYALGGRLPADLHDWVRHDLTDADWRLRQILRTLLQAAIPIVVILVLPIPVALRIPMAVLVLIGALSVGAAYGDELRERRFRQHGLTPPPSEPPPSGRW